MAEEAGTAVLDAPAPSDPGSPPAAPSVPAVETPPVAVPPVEPPAPVREQVVPEPTPRQTTREPAPEPVVVREHTRQAPQSRSTPETPEPAPLEGARDATDTLLNWRDLADPEYRSDPVLAKYKSPGEALKALVHQERLLGNSIQIPREG